MREAADLPLINEYADALTNRLGSVCLWVLHILPRMQSWDIRSQRLGLLPSDARPASDGPRPLRPCQQSTPERDLEGAKMDRMVQLKRQELRLRSQKWYCALIIWYVMKHLGDVFDEAPAMMSLVRSRMVNLFAIRDDEDTMDARNAQDEPLGCMMRWYHYHSLQKIHHRLHLDPQEHAALQTDSIKWQGMAEKAMRQFCQGQLWNMDHFPRHDITTTALIGPEIGARRKGVTLRSTTCIEYAQNLINLRPATSKLLAGRSPVRRWDGQHEIRSATPRPAPWELTCLEHYVPVLLGILEAPQGQAVPKSCKEFMLSDYSFAPSWDTSNPAPPGDWWDLTTTCIIAAKMIDDQHSMPKSEQVPLPLTSSEDKGASRVWLYGGHLASGSGTSHRTPMQQPADKADRDRARPGAISPFMAQAETAEQRDDRYLEKIKKLVEDAIKQSKATDRDSSTIFEWNKRKPPRIYHAESVVQSLEDTPYLSKLLRQKNVKVRQNVQKRLGQDGPDWSLKSVKEFIEPLKLLHASAFDFTLKADGNHMPEISLPVPKGRARWPLIAGKFFTRHGVNFGAQEVTKHGSELWDLLLLDKQQLFDKQQETETTNHEDYKKLPIDVRTLLRSRDNRHKLLSSIQTSLFTTLNDSVSHGATAFVWESCSLTNGSRWLMSVQSTELCKSFSPLTYVHH
jgi:hypothetical protein